MNIHEYQSKAILRSYGVNVPAGKPAFSVEEAVENARELGTGVVVVKAQIHAGGRGKAGGVKVVHSLEAVEKAARYAMAKYQLKNIIVTRSENGMTLVTPAAVTHIPTKAQEVYAVSGAGDTVIAVFTAGLAGGLMPVDSARMANLAASVVVAKLGTYAISKDELLEVLK